MAPVGIQHVRILMASVTQEPRSHLSTSRNALVICFLVILFVSGIPLLLGNSPPSSISRTLPFPIGILWGFALTLGSLMALLGTFWKNLSVGIALEQIGVVASGSAALVYSVALVVMNGVHAMPAAGFACGYGIACFVRWAQLQRFINFVVRTNGVA